ncbi:PKD domain-containing protein, partial [Streptacidiphilus jiangxiensis]
MQLKRVSVLAAMAVVAGLTSTLGPVASATAADPAPVPLSSSLADFGQMVATPSHLFFTAPSALALGGTKAENQVLVTDLDGGNATPIPNEPGAAAMALSKDGSTLYVARSKDSSIAAIDATAAVPAETAHYALGDGVTPTSVAVIGSTVWFGYAKGTEYGLGSLDLSGATPVVTLTPIVDAGFAPVHLKAFGTSFGTSGLVLADGDHTGSWVRSYDVSSGTPVAGKTVTRAGVSLVALDVTADGLDVVTGWDDNAVEVYDIASMTVYQAYPVPKITDGTMMPTSLAIGADGILAVGVQGGDVHTFAGGELRSFGIGGGVPGGAVAWSSDQSRLYTITADSEGGDNPVLHILTNPELATTRLNATTPATAVPGQQVTVSGTLASGWGAWDAGITVSVSRDGTVLDAAVPVNGDGSYSFTDTLPTAADGTVYHYAVSYAGDAKHAAAQASAQISEPAPLTPLAQISPVGGSQSLTVQADTGSSTDSSTITSRTMDFGDGTGPVDISTPGKTTHTYEFPGTYQVKLTEGDAAGRKASVTYPVTVGLAASARMNLIARDAAGALWQYQGSGISSRVFEPRAEIGPGWNTYKMLTSLAGQRADGTG